MAKQQDYQIQTRGLFTNPSTFGVNTVGAASTADNVNIDRENIVSTRRGFDFYGNALGTGIIKNLIQYKNALIASTSDDLLWYDSNNDGLWAQYPGTYSPPSDLAGSRIRSIQANKNLYLTTNLGIYKTDILSTAPFQAGAPKGLGGTATINNTGSGFMTNDTFVGYEILWGYTDANNNLILGPPSELVVVGNTAGGPIATTQTLVGGTGYVNGTYNNVPLVGGSGSGAQATFIVGSTTVTSVVITTNGINYRPGDILTASNTNLGGSGSGFSITVATISGGTANVDVKFLMPKGIQSNWIYQVYRSLESNDFLLDPNAVPSANLFLTFQGNVTNTDITNGYISFTDITPDNLLGTELYTNPNQQGINQANWQPPLAQDIAYYKNYTFYANTRTVQTLQNESLIASGAPNGIQIGDTITFTDSGTSSTFTLTGGSTEVPSTGHFQIFSTGDPALDITNTAQSMLRVLNQYTSNTFLVGYYLSSFTETPGQLLFQKLTLDQNYFYMNCSRSTCFSPTIPSSGTTTQSSNDVSPNRLFYSKVLQPDAVPLLNYYDVGSAVEQIDRILPLRDGLIILKQDGIYRLSGTSPVNFNIELIDNSLRSIAPNSADILNNFVYFLSNIGVVACSESGVAIISRPIENLLLQNISPQLFPNLQEVCFGVGYNSDKKYILALPSSGTDTVATKEYIYNYITEQWTSWSKPMSSGVINSKDDKLYLGSQLINTHFNVLQERKNFTNSDLADEAYNINIISFNGKTLTLTDVSNIVVGGSIQQTQSTLQLTATVVEVNTILNTVTVDETITLWIAGTAQFFTPIPITYSTIQIDCGNAGILKHIMDISFIFSVTQFPSMTVNFQNDLTSDVYIAPIVIINTVGWGDFAWGAGPWGGTGSAQKRVRTLVPRAISRSNWLLVSLSNNLCFADFGLSGMSIMFTNMSERQGHG